VRSRTCDKNASCKKALTAMMMVSKELKILVADKRNVCFPNRRLVIARRICPLRIKALTAMIE